MDIKVIVRAVIRPFLIWAALLITPILAGYPGAVCMTPLAWVLGIMVGLDVVRLSRNRHAMLALLEAGIGGALLGVLQGLTFIGVTRWLMETETTEENVLALWIGMVLVGMIVCAAAAVIMAAIRQTRLRRES